jgi:exo-beta-1,3-glucanase (GH17 family)
MHTNNQGKLNQKTTKQPTALHAKKLQRMTTALAGQVTVWVTDSGYCGAEEQISDDMIPKMQR